MGCGGKFIGENLWGPQEMGWEREQGILPQVLYSRAHEAGYLLDRRRRVAVLTIASFTALDSDKCSLYGKKMTHPFYKQNAESKSTWPVI